MSSRRNSLCDAITKKGKSCKNYCIKGAKWCHIHSKNFNSKLIVHTSPAVNFIPTTFNQTIPSGHTCKFRNIYGEHICQNETKDRKYCDEHEIQWRHFVKTLRRLIDLGGVYKQQRFTIDSFFKLVKNTLMFVLKHQQKIVQFSLGNVLDAIVRMVDSNLDHVNYFHTPLTFTNKSKHLSLYLRMLLEFRPKLLNIHEPVQIQRNRELLISNNIKVNKLTEICLKANETSTTIMPVFCKGVDKNVLKFLV